MRRILSNKASCRSGLGGVQDRVQIGLETLDGVEHVGGYELEEPYEDSSLRSYLG